ncbi:hypothetical protein CEUSTIGMA_g9819.t1 [Chlamydomonas eustigma]|uniref:Uncharacterized protein n=1 Tax=Chlamydomonas eustigma TaxID=1157962 RepID=A0A250XH35_9CHLO|nr:hypothetical protein CEUSTIGMA_g9819.t1 [Chlamydomonas eustigma]|eukprot:GAX82391.1 hypothetical protein CEUSTIGMA_g9819.t1 [Chlamydomonas eustigma]
MMPPTLKNVSSLPTKRKVVLPEGLSGHHHIPHHDPWHQWEGLIVILVILHIGVLLFYAWILMEDKKKEKKQRSMHSSIEDRNRKGGGTFSLRGGTLGNSPANKNEWRTPKEILASYQKQRLGKV